MAQQDSIISHFSHLGHDLVKLYYTGSFRCDMCWEHLNGTAYGCHAGCDFAIHDSCAGHPQKLSSPEHHAHPLVLVQTRRDAALLCDICIGSCAPSCFLYRCPPCGFDMHPTCVRLPRVVRSSRHPEHDLTLVVGEGQCAACHVAAGNGWFYRCATCNNVDFHVSCASVRDEDDIAGPGHAGGNGHVRCARQARDDDIADELRRARIRATDMAYASAKASLNLMTWTI